MLLIGSASVARECARLGPIDEFRIKVNPVVLGGVSPSFLRSRSGSHSSSWRAAPSAVGWSASTTKASDSDCYDRRKTMLSTIRRTAI